MQYNNPISSLAQGFDPDALYKVQLDTRERLSLLNQPLDAGPIFTNVSPDIPSWGFIPKELDTDDLLFSPKNDIKVEELLNSGDINNVNLGLSYLEAKSGTNPVIKHNLNPYINYMTNPSVNEITEAGYSYDMFKTPEENQQDAYQKWKNESWWVTNSFKTLGKSLLKLPKAIVLKLGNALAISSASLQYLAEDDPNKNFMTYIAENDLVRYMSQAEQDYKTNFSKFWGFTDLKSPKYDQEGFFGKLKYGQFWTDEAVDFTAFMIASRIIGGRITKGISALPKLGGATRVGAYADKILNGKIPGLVGKGLQKITGAKDIAGITAFATNTLNESVLEGIDIYDKVGKNLKNEINPETGEIYKDHEILKKQQDAASLVYNGNLAILLLSNGLENRWTQRALGRDISQSMVSGITLDATGEAVTKQFTNKLVNKIAQTGLGKRVLYYGPELIEGILKEGYWEENAQSAITRLANLKHGLGYYERIGEDGVHKESFATTNSDFKDFFTQLLKQTYDASTLIGGKGDFEVSTAIGSGGLLSIGGTTFSNTLAIGQQWTPDHVVATQLDPKTGKFRDMTGFQFFKSERKRRENSRLRAIAEINNARTNFISLGDVVNQDGTISIEKLKTKGNKIQELIDKYNLSEDIENPIIKRQIEDEVFRDYVLAHLVNGTYNQFKERLNSEKSEEVLALFGVSDIKNDRLGEYIDLADKLESTFNKVMSQPFSSQEITNFEQLNHWKTLTTSRVFDLFSKMEINANSINQQKKYLTDTFGTVFPKMTEYDRLISEYDRLKETPDSEGIWKTQQELIEKESKELSEEVESLLKGFDLDNQNKFFKNYEDLHRMFSYQESVSEEIFKYMVQPQKAIDIFRDEFFENLPKTELEGKSDKEVIDEILEKTETKETTQKSSDDAVVTEEPPKDIINTEVETGDFTSIFNQFNAQKTQEDLDKIYNALDESTKNHPDIQKYYQYRGEEIELMLEEQLENNQETPTESTSTEETTEETTEPTNQDTLEDTVADDIPSDTSDNDSDISYNSVFVTSSLDSLDRPNSLTEEDLIDNPYNSFRNELIESGLLHELITYQGHYLVLEKDDFISGNIGNLNKEAFDQYFNLNKSKYADGVGVALVLKNSQGESVKVVDLFPDTHKSIHNKNIQFYLNNKKRTESEQKQMASIRNDRKKVPIETSLELFKEQTELLGKAIEEARAGKQIRVKLINTSGLQPISRKGKQIIYTPLSNLIDIKLDFKSGAAIATDKKGIEYRVGIKNIGTQPDIHQKVLDIINTEYNTESEAINIRTNFLNRLFFNTINQQFTIESVKTPTGIKYKLVPYLISETGKIIDHHIINGTRRVRISRKGLEGKMIVDGKVLSKQEYIDFITPFLDTKYKTIYNPDGSQYKGLVSSYIEYDIIDSRIVSKTTINKEELINELKNKIKPIDLVPFGTVYIDNKGKKFWRATSFKDKIDKVFGTSFASRGNLIDEITREFLKSDFIPYDDFSNLFNNIKNRTHSSGIYSSEFKKELYNSLLEFKNHNSNLIYITDIPTLYGFINNVPIAGTIDILAYDVKTGEFSIIDLKTAEKSRRDGYTKKDHYYKTGDALQLNIYKNLFKQRTGLEINTLKVLPLKVSLNKETTSYESVQIEKDITNKDLLLNVNNLSDSELVKLITDNQIGSPTKFEYKFNSGVKYTYNNKTIDLSVSDTYYIYDLIDNIFKDTIDNILVKYPEFKPLHPKQYAVEFGESYEYDEILVNLENNGIKFTDKEDRLRILDYYQALLTDEKTKLINKNPNFATIHQGNQKPGATDAQDDSFVSGVEMGATDIGTSTTDTQEKKADIERRRQEVERIAKLPFKERIAELKKLGIITDVYRYGNRPVVVVNIAGINLPFYRSSAGTSGKTKGKWFPFFGFGKHKTTDTDLTWLIKADTKSNENNFNSKAITEYSNIINSTLNWEHSLDQSMQNPFFNPEITFKGDEEGFNERIFGEKDRGVINDGGDTILKAYGIIDEINAKYNAELAETSTTEEANALEKSPITPEIVENPNTPETPLGARKIVSNTDPIIGEIYQFTIDGYNIKFNSKNGYLTVNGDKDFWINSADSLSLLNQLFHELNQIKDSFMEKLIIRTKQGEYQTYILKYPTQDKGLQIATSWIFNPQEDYLGDISFLNIDGGTIISKKDFLPETENDIQNILNINC